LNLHFFEKLYEIEEFEEDEGDEERLLFDECFL
jgi:hypothetical protein